MRIRLFLVGLVWLLIPAQGHACSGSLFSPSPKTELPDAYTPAFSRDVEALLMNGQYDKLESMADELRTSGAYFLGGYPKLAVFYDSVTDYKGNGCGPQVTTYTLKEKQDAMWKWIAARRTSLTARVAIADFLLNAAWSARGNGYANQVRPDQWAAYRQRLQDAGGFIKDIRPVIDPYVYQEFLRMSPSRRVLDAVYEEATRKYPAQYEYYDFYADRMQEKWFGGPGEQAAYVKSLVEPSAPDDSKIAFTFLVGSLASPAMYGLDTAAVKQAYVTKEKQYGLMPKDWGNLFLLAVRDKDTGLQKKILPQLKKLAQVGDSSAQNVLAVAHASGLGDAQDQSAIGQGAQKTAEQGAGNAEFLLGWMYEHWEPHDDAAALQWYLRSAKAGNPIAENNVGFFYENGRVVKQDYAEAARWYQQAVDKGQERAEWHLGRLYYDGSGVPQNRVTAMSLITLAAKAGDPDAASWLAQQSR